MKTLLNTLVLALFIMLKSLMRKNLAMKRKKYTLGEITVTGNTTFSEQTIITYSGLRKGEEITFLEKKLVMPLKNYGI